MAAEVFGRGMNDQIDAHGQGFAPPWGGEGVVDDEEQIVAFGYFSHGLNITDLQDGVGQRLNVENFRVGLNSGFVGSGISHVGHGGRNTEAGKFFGQQPVGAPIDVSARNDVVALIQHRHECCRDGGHS